MLEQFVIILPEIMLTAIAMIMQIVAVYSKQSQARMVALITSLLALGVVFYLLFCIPDGAPTLSLSFVVNPFIFLCKAFILGFTIMSLVAYHDFTKISNIPLRMEFITLVLLSTVGVFISISARDLILLFCGLELQALSGYALAAFNTNDSKSSEAGLKYFILGALMSCLILFGISFLYGFGGNMQFAAIRFVLNSDMNIGMIIGAVLLVAGILFKLSAAPLHIWTPDVYEGAPVSSVTYFAAAQKIGTLIVLINILDKLVGNYTAISTDLIKIVAVLSMIVGSLGAIMQNSLKRLMAYSTILNMGYVLVGVCLRSPEGDDAAFIYMLIYAAGTIAFFASLIALFGAKSESVTFDDLRGIGQSNKPLAGAIAVIMFSMIGLPPLAGFFGKYYIFYNAISEGEVILALIGVVTSVIAAFYYLKVIKYMYFMEAEREIALIQKSRGLSLIVNLNIAFIILFLFFASKYIV